MREAVLGLFRHIPNAEASSLWTNRGNGSDDEPNKKCGV